MKNQLEIKGKVNIQGLEFTDIEGGFGEGKKCILAKDIAEIHNKKMDHINRAINRNRDQFKDGIDIMNAKGSDLEIDLITNNIFTQGSVNASKNIYLLSSTGYTKIINILQDPDMVLVEKILKEYFKTNVKILNGMKRKELEFVYLLENILREFDLIIEKQKHVKGKFIDAYIPELNIAIEYDENNHDHYDQESEKEREKLIKDEIGCEFIRVSDENVHSVNVGIVLSQIMEVKKNEK